MRACDDRERGYFDSWLDDPSWRSVPKSQRIDVASDCARIRGLPTIYRRASSPETSANADKWINKYGID